MSDNQVAVEAPAQNPTEAEPVAKADATESAKPAPSTVGVIKAEDSSADKGEKRNGRDHGRGRGNGRKFDNRRGGKGFGSHRRKYAHSFILLQEPLFMIEQAQ